MNEYKNPIKKMWQQSNQSIQGGNNVQLPYTQGTAAPTTTPGAVGLVFIDTTNAKVYVSTGTTASTDWKALN